MIGDLQADNTILITIRTVRLLRVWISEGLTQANSYFEGVGIPMSVEFDRGSPGKFDSRTLNRKILSSWTGRKMIGDLQAINHEH